MSISRRGLFGFLASLPVMAPAIIREAAAAPTIAPLTVDPPLIAVGEAIGDGYLGAGHITWVDPDYDERTGEVLRPRARLAAQAGRPLTLCEWTDCRLYGPPGK